jgi:choline dehydrogenase-like flavoprotein
MTHFQAGIVPSFAKEGTMLAQNCGGRISLRFGPHDFKRRSIDGLGDDWPISYEELKPYRKQVRKISELRSR